MAELSGFWTTSGTPSGDQQASYTQAQLAIAHKIIAAASGYQGVAPGFLNELAPAAAGANTVSIAAGGAMVDGLWFINDISQNVNVPSAVSGTRIDRIVLRATWAGFNVSVHRIEGTASAPGITQNSGTTYDIQLCQVSVTTGGAVTVTDERTWASPVFDRQGGSASVWSTPGTTDYTATGMRMQGGTRTVASSVTVTFPVAFSAAPLVVANSVQARCFVAVTAVSATQCTLSLHKDDGTQVTDNVYWVAIGPK